jgi:hypothetical protein
MKKTEILLLLEDLKSMVLASDLEDFPNVLIQFAAGENPAEAPTVAGRPTPEVRGSLFHFLQVDDTFFYPNALAVLNSEDDLGLRALAAAAAGAAPAYALEYIHRKNFLNNAEQ